MRNYQNLPRPTPTWWKRVRCFFKGNHAISWAVAAVGGRNIQYCIRCGITLAEHSVSKDEAKLDRYAKGIFRRR